MVWDPCFLIAPFQAKIDHSLVMVEIPTDQRTFGPDARHPLRLALGSTLMDLYAAPWHAARPHHLPLRSRLLIAGPQTSVDPATERSGVESWIACVAPRRL
jgi:hypothetical protein